MKTLATAFREFVLEANDEEIREAIESEGEDPTILEKEGRAAIDKALMKC